MTNFELVLLRHGESEWNAKNLFRLGELYELSENNVLAKDYFNKIIMFAGKTDIANLARDKLAK